MKRIASGFGLAGVLAVLVGHGPAIAQQLTTDISTLLKELPEPTSQTLLTILQAQPALEPLAEPVVVTDDELLTAGSTPLLAVPAASSSPDFVVDDDLAQCPDADFTTAAGIQIAVAAAPPGSVIRVCPGLYTPVVVDKTLRLEAPVQHGQATQCQASLLPDPQKDAIVDAANTPVIGFTVAADNVVLYGFTVQNTSGNPGILTLSTFSGYQILFNVVQQNTFGLYLNSSGLNPTRVERNCFRFNNKPGSASGDGVYSDQGLRNALVRENFFTGHQSAAIVFALNQQDVAIEHNDIIEDAGTIVLVNTQRARVAYNHSVDIGGSGIFVGGGVSDAHIAYNLIDNPGGTGITTNVQFVGVPNIRLRIEKNHIRSSPFDGIRLNQTDMSVVHGNKSQGNARDGIRLQNDSDLNEVNNNLSRDNGRDGMRVDGGVGPAQSEVNTIEQNKMLGNAEHDCHDDTVGGGTATTANFWFRNIGKTENRPGLCKNATVVTP